MDIIRWFIASISIVILLAISTGFLLSELVNLVRYIKKLKETRNNTPKAFPVYRDGLPPSL